MTGLINEPCFLMDAHLATLGLACLKTFGPIRLQLLLKHFATSTALWSANLDEFLERRIDVQIARRFIEERAAVNVGTVMEACKQSGTAFIGWDDTRYPDALRQLPDPPVGLFVRGSLPVGLTVAVVGTRRPSPYGTLVTERIVRQLAGAGLHIVSGLALGIDGTAHEAALAAGSLTSAVLACGVETPYPTHHLRLAERMLEQGGALISQFPPGTLALRHHFPIRNRIIAGLASGVLVTEAPKKSGALLTARLALEYNRDVFAVPGPITAESCVGTNALIRDGAHVVVDGRNILDAYSVPSAAPAPLSVPTEVERRVLDALGAEPRSIDQLTRISTLDARTVSAALTKLEMQGWIHQLDPAHYVRSH